MSRALADHRPQTLRRYALRIYDGATRLYRKHPTDEAQTVLEAATKAWRQAHDLGPGSDRLDRESAASMINWTLVVLNSLLRGRGDAELVLHQP